MNSKRNAIKFYLQLILVLVIFHCSNGQGDVAFLGATGTKALFYLRGKTYFSEEMCTFRGMHAGSIDTEEENTILANFITENLQESVWIAATDYAEEGVYRQIRTGLPLEFSNWNQSAPVQDLERSCLIMNAEGELQPEYCYLIFDQEKYHHPLCETPLYGFRFQEQNSEPKTLPRVAKKTKSEVKVTPKRQSEPIGSIGGKTFSVIIADDAGYYHRALDYCHMEGKRLLTPKNQAEIDFVVNWLIWYNVRDPVLTSISNLLTPNCTYPMSYYRSIYNGQVFSNPGESHGYRALVLAVGQGGLTYTSYISGGGPHVICEEEVEEELPCGLVGYSPNEIIRNEVPLNINEPPGTEFWRGTLFNVLTSVTIQHPHNRYLQALRTPTAYWLTTTNVTAEFISVEGTDTIIRSSIFYCNDSTESVQYNFEIKVQ